MIMLAVAVHGGKQTNLNVVLIGFHHPGAFVSDLDLKRAGIGSNNYTGLAISLGESPQLLLKRLVEPQPVCVQTMELELHLLIKHGLGSGGKDEREFTLVVLNGLGSYPGYCDCLLAQQQQTRAMEHGMPKFSDSRADAYSQYRMNRLDFQVNACLPNSLRRGRSAYYSEQYNLAWIDLSIKDDDSLSPPLFATAPPPSVDILVAHDTVVTARAERGQHMVDSLLLANLSRVIRSVQHQFAIGEASKAVPANISLPMHTSILVQVHLIGALPYANAAEELSRDLRQALGALESKPFQSLSIQVHSSLPKEENVLEDALLPTAFAFARQRCASVDAHVFRQAILNPGKDAESHRSRFALHLPVFWFGKSLLVDDELESACTMLPDMVLVVESNPSMHQMLKQLTITALARLWYDANQGVDSSSTLLLAWESTTHAQNKQTLALPASFIQAFHETTVLQASLTRLDAVVQQQQLPRELRQDVAQLRAEALAQGDDWPKTYALLASALKRVKAAAAITHV